MTSNGTNGRRQSSTMSSRRTSHGANDGLPPMMSSADANMPVRHPRPLTAAELHLELEREQEAVVNKLTRELSVLRAQHSASVASNASQASSVSNTALLDGSLSHPTPTRQHRSSSTASSRSISNPSASQTPLQHPQPTAPMSGVSQASFDRAAAVGATTSSSSTAALPSRNPSIRSASGQSTPALTPATSTTLPHRPSISQAMSSVSTAGSFSYTPSGPLSPFTPSPSHTDIAAARAELDTVKQENEALRQRVRALERALKQRRDSITNDASAGAQGTRYTTADRLSVSTWAADAAQLPPARDARSDSISTTASSRRPEGLEREDSIRVGESAAGVGLGLR